MAKFKLFVWNNVLYDYTPGVIFALAENVEEAREAVLENCTENWSHDSLVEAMSSEPEVYNSRYGFHLLGGG